MADVRANSEAHIQNRPMNHAAFSNILNFRDVGKTINDFLGEKRVAEGRVFRSARPDDATISDRQRLSDEYGIKTIMDLRTVTEHGNQAKKRQADLKVPTLLKSNAALAEPVKIPGMNYLEININGKGFERSLLWQLSAWSFTKLVALMAVGHRTEAISILGHEVMQPRGLIGLGYDSMDHCGPEIAEALRAYTVPQNYGILVHCTQGKDRTGLIIALILFIVDVSLPAISHDYVMSEEELLPERESRLKEIKSIGLTEDFAGCPSDWIEKMDEHLRETYGGVDAYCDGIGFGVDDREKLREILRY